MLRILKFIFFCVIPVFLLAGCWDSEEIEERAYVVVLGLDKKDDHSVEVTFQIANPQVGTSSQAEAQNEPSENILTITAPDILSAKELANTVVSREMNFDHLRTIIIGEDLAKSKLFPHILGSAVVDPELRRDINLIVSKEMAQTFIHKNKPKFESQPHKYYNFMADRWVETAYSPQGNINRYFLHLSGELFLAIYATTDKEDDTYEPRNKDYIAGRVPQKGGDPVQMIGSAVFKNGVMIGTLTGRETRIALFLRPKAVTYIQTETFPDPFNNKESLTVRIIRHNVPKIKVNANKTPVEVKAVIPVDLQIFSDPSLTNYTTNIENQKILKRSLKEAMEKNTMEFIKKTQDEFKAEPFLWYLPARREFWTLKEFEEFNWEEKYQTADVHVDYDIHIESFGEIVRPFEFKKKNEE